jgi:hypothetical protein
MGWRSCLLYMSAVDSSKEGIIEVLSTAVGAGLLCKLQILTQLLGCLPSFIGVHLYGVCRIF